MLLIAAFVSANRPLGSPQVMVTQAPGPYDTYDMHNKNEVRVEPISRLLLFPAQVSVSSPCGDWFLGGWCVWSLNLSWKQPGALMVPHVGLNPSCVIIHCSRLAVQTQNVKGNQALGCAPGDDGFPRWRLLHAPCSHTTRDFLVHASVFLPIGSFRTNNDKRRGWSRGDCIGRTHG